MKIKKGFMLRNLLDEHVAVAVGEAGIHFNGMIRLNDTAAWCWQQLQTDITEEELVTRMCAQYDDLTPESAAQDVRAFLEVIDAALEK